MSKDKTSAREKFRSSVNIKDINVCGNEDPDYEYKFVAATFAEGLKRIDRYIDSDWEVCYSKDKPKDDRKNTGNQDGKDQDLRMSPVSITTRGGHTMIRMRCLKTNRVKNELKKDKRDTTRYEAAQKKIITKGNQVKILDHDVDLNLTDDNKSSTEE